MGDAGAMGTFQDADAIHSYDQSFTRLDTAYSRAHFLLKNKQTEALFVKKINNDQDKKVNSGRREG